ncbi:hypothetical protein RRG08_007889 [Elysia crispata]|uniref:Uncharacterized protein n=1 Tax=Elysia crispata TaxID=231223 RepID=A0AAE0XWR6_9GAST|nr:hypothetical protein RRG08_007889 [Elysia crispata]
MNQLVFGLRLVKMRMNNGYLRPLLARTDYVRARQPTEGSQGFPRVPPGEDGLAAKSCRPRGEKTTLHVKSPAYGRPSLTLEDG